MSPNQTSNPLPGQTLDSMHASFPLFSGAGIGFGTVVKWLALVGFCLVTLVFAWPIFPFVVGIIMLILVRRGETQRRVNCWTLAIAVEKRIPLGRTIVSLASESGTLMRSRLWRLFSYVELGARFEDAICGVPNVIPRFSLPLLRIGCRSGRPSRAMQIICSQDDNENYKLSQTLLGRLFYLLLCYVFTTLIVIFMFLKIVPAFEKINADFNMPVGPLLKSCINASYFFYTYWYLFVMPLGLVTFLVFGFCFYVLLRSLGIVTFDLPGTERFMRKFHRARIQESIALAAECEMPIGDAMRELALFYPTWSIRNHLGRATDRVNSGRDWKQELRDVGLLSQTEYAVVTSAEASGDLPWTLRLLAGKGRRRSMYWAQWMQQLIFLGLLLVLAIFIAWGGLAMFEFLTKLITLLS